MTSLRQEIIDAIDTAVDSGARLFKACEAINLNQRRLRRWRRSEGDERTGGYRAVGQRLSEAEKDVIVSTFEQPDLRELPITVAHATLLDRGIYLASPSTIVRVLNERAAATCKRVSRKTTKAKRPQLKATQPNQVWCWDITWLDGPVKGTYYYLYMIIDMFSRKVVAWDIYAKEDGTLARQLFAEALRSENVEEGKITVHSDNGKPMRSVSLLKLFELLGVQSSYGRPHTSNDNAYAESLFATFKGRIAFPEYFASMEAAQWYCLEFFTWYNQYHLHSALDYLTPQAVHAGEYAETIEKRNAVLAASRAMHPSRFGSKQRVYAVPQTVELKHRTQVAQAEA